MGWERRRRITDVGAVEEEDYVIGKETDCWS